jgi:NitT/TauT family transport system permease protein
VLAGILVLTVFALLLDVVVSAIENRLLVWRPSASETERV